MFISSFIYIFLCGYFGREQDSEHSREQDMLMKL